MYFNCSAKLQTKILKYMVIFFALVGLVNFLQLKVHAETSFVDLAFKVNQKDYTSKSIKKNLDLAPFVENGSTLVPFRAILEELGYDIQWEPKTSTITATTESSTIKLKINSKESIINGESKTLTVAPKIVSGRTVVPLRFLSENSGATVVWDSSTQSIYITKVGQYDTGKVLFYEKGKDKNTVYVYDGKDIITIPLIDKEIVNWYSFKDQVLLTIFDKKKNNNSFCVFRNNNFETLLDDFDIKDAFEYNDNLMIHGYDRSQKFDKLCRFDGTNFYVVMDNFYVGNRFIFKDKLVINKYDNNRNYTLLAFDKSSWTPGILSDGFIIKDVMMDNNLTYITGIWQTGSSKPLATFDGNSITSSSFKIIHADANVDVNKVVMFNGRFFAIIGNELVIIENSNLNKVVLQDSGIYIKYNFDLIKSYKNKLYVGANSGATYLGTNYKSMAKPSSFLDHKGTVFEIPQTYVSNTAVQVDKNTYISITSTSYKKMIEKFDATEFRVESDKFLMLGKDTDNNDQLLYTFNGDSIKKAIDVSKINNNVSVGANTFIDVRDKNRITNTDRNTMLFYNGSVITNLVVGMDTKKWANVGNSLIFAGYEGDIKRNKIYSYGTEFNEQLGNFDVDYWDLLNSTLFVGGSNKDVNSNQLYKFNSALKSLVRDNIKIVKIIKARGSYYFVDGYDKDPNSPLKDQRVLYIYDDSTGKFIEMKVNLQMSDMIFVN